MNLLRYSTITFGCMRKDITNNFNGASAPNTEASNKETKMIDVEGIIDRTQHNLLESIDNVLGYTIETVNEFKAERETESDRYYEGYLMGLARARNIVLEYKQKTKFEEEKH